MSNPAACTWGLAALGAASSVVLSFKVRPRWETLQEVRWLERCGAEPSSCSLKRESTTTSKAEGAQLGVEGLHLPCSIVPHLRRLMNPRAMPLAPNSAPRSVRVGCSWGPHGAGRGTGMYRRKRSSMEVTSPREAALIQNPNPESRSCPGTSRAPRALLPFQPKP